MWLITPTNDKSSYGNKYSIHLILIRMEYSLQEIYYKPCRNTMVTILKEIISIIRSHYLIKIKVEILILGNSWEWCMRSLMRKIQRKICREFLMILIRISRDSLMKMILGIWPVNSNNNYLSKKLKLLWLS